MGCGASSSSADAKPPPPDSTAVEARDENALADPAQEYERQQGLAKARRLGELDGTRAETGFAGTMAHS